MKRCQWVFAGLVQLSIEPFSFRESAFPEYRVATFRQTEFGVVRPPRRKLGRTWGGDTLNKIPDRCVIDVDIRYLPGQDPDALLKGARALPGVSATPLPLPAVEFGWPGD